MKEVKEDVIDAAPTLDEPRQSGLSSLKTQDDSPGVTSVPPQDKQLVPLAKAFSTADQVPKFYYGPNTSVFHWRTAVDGLLSLHSEF